MGLVGFVDVVVSVAERNAFVAVVAIMFVAVGSY